MTGLPKVTVIIVNWNGCADTLACLASVAEACGGPWDVVVVDNGSVDDSVCRVREAFPKVEVIEAGANLGFTGGNNIGMRWALASGTDYVLLLNNDAVVERSSLQELVAAGESNTDFGILTPTIYYFDRQNEPWFTGSRIDLSRGEAVHDNSAPPLRTDPVKTVPWASGCAMLIRGSIIERLGGFDDRYFLNWEDVDLSLRAAELGWRVGLVPSARIYHKVGRSFASTWGTGTYYYVRNHLLLMSLHAAGNRRARRCVMRHHLRRAIRGIVYREPHCVRGIIVTSRGIIDFLRKRFGPWSTRPTV